MNFIEEQIVKIGEVEVLNLLPQLGIDTVKKEIIEGLTAPSKSISSKFFYDQKGSELFEEITRLEEYYPTRCEKEILSGAISELDIGFRNLDVVELGSGDSSKIVSIFRQIPANLLSGIRYYPVDISQSALENAVKDISKKFTLKSITGIAADFHHQLHLIPAHNKRLFFFLGSTIGNFSPDEVQEFMTTLGSSMNKGDSLVLGVDMVKEIPVIEAAYNDRKGVTAKFNKNILNVMNDTIGADFNLENFDHLAFYDTKNHKIEMHLKAKSNLRIELKDQDLNICFRKDETIHTENSYKFTGNQLEKIGSYGGMVVKKIISDSNGWFSLVHYVRK